MYKQFCKHLLCFSFLWFVSSSVSADDFCNDVEKMLNVRNEVNRLVDSFEIHRSFFTTQRIDRVYCRELKQNLEEKFLRESKVFTFSTNDIIQHGINFEAFRLTTLITSGVVPKRYFGFFDEGGDTAEYEKALRVTIISSVQILNTFAKSEGINVQVSEREVAITFLAEGGALLLTDPDESPNKVHPITDIGLDNFRLAFEKYPKLLAELDLKFGTKLNNLLIHVGKKSILTRPMTFREAILGTGIMYLFEKDICQSKMKEKWNESLGLLPLTTQFIASSLVYNSGIMFPKDTVKLIEELSTSEYLDRVNKKSDRPKLPVLNSDERLSRLRLGDRLPRQLTSWSAVFHVLQRYGAWVALERYSNIFNQGDFVRRE